MIDTVDEFASISPIQPVNAIPDDTIDLTATTEPQTVILTYRREKHT